MKRRDWKIRTAANPLFNDDGERCMSEVDARRRIVWIDPAVRAEDRPQLVRDALATAGAANPAAAEHATGERLPDYENDRLAGDAADFIVKLYGVRGAELIRDGYKPATDDDVTRWSRADGRECVECNHCGHTLRDGAAVRRHLEKKHGIGQVTVRGLPFALVPVPGWPKGNGGADVKLVIDLTSRRVLHADRLTPAEVDELLARARRLVESDRNEGRAAA